MSVSNVIQDEIPLALLTILRKQFGDNLVFKQIKQVSFKSVYEMTAENKEYILQMISSNSVTKHYKYMSAYGIQQQLFKDGFPTAGVFFIHVFEDKLIFVCEKLKGKVIGCYNEEFMYSFGQLTARLHLTTQQEAYKHPLYLIPYPNKFLHFLFKFRYFMTRRVASYFTYFKLRNFPKGICHRDLNKYNLLIDADGEMRLIDFENTRYMPFVQEFVRFYNCRLDNKKAFPLFLQGYESLRPLTKDEKAYLLKEIGLDAADLV